MGKMITSLSLIIGFMGLFYLMGILSPEESATTSIITLLTSPEDISLLDLGTSIVAGISALGLVAGIAIALWTREIRYAALFGMASLFLTIGYDITKIYSSINSVSPVFGAIFSLILVVFLVIYGISVVDWWSGTDG